MKITINNSKIIKWYTFFNKINKSNGNIFYLPSKNIESLFWEYLESLDSSDKFYYDSRIEEYAISSDIIKREGPDSDKYSDFEDSLTKKNGLKIINIYAKFYLNIGTRKMNKNRRFL